MQCANNNDIMMTSTHHPEDKSTDGKFGNETTFAMTNTAPYYLPVSTIYSIISSSNTPIFKDLFSPRRPASNVSFLAMIIIITVSGFALVSSIASCYIACRMYQRGPLLPIGTPFHQQTRNDGNSAIEFTSVPPRRGLTQSHFSSGSPTREQVPRNVEDCNEIAQSLESFPTVYQSIEDRLGPLSCEIELTSIRHTYFSADDVEHNQHDSPLVDASATFIEVNNG